MTEYKPCNYDYSKLKSGQIFFSHGCDFIGALIRLGEALDWKSINDLGMCNHAGFLYEINGQIFAAEVAAHGIQLNSIDSEYRRANNQIVNVLQWDAFNSTTLLKQFNDYVALWVRRKQDTGYDLFGAIKASSWVRKYLSWIPGFKNDSNKEFCSEDVYSTLKQFGCIFPLDWAINPPNPKQLFDYLFKLPHFTKVEGFKIDFVQTNEYHLGAAL